MRKKFTSIPGELISSRRETMGDKIHYSYLYAPHPQSEDRSFVLHVQISKDNFIEGEHIFHYSRKDIEDAIAEDCGAYPSEEVVAVEKYLKEHPEI